MAAPSFWSDAQAATAVSRERPNSLLLELDFWRAIDLRQEELDVLFELLREGDLDALVEIRAGLSAFRAEGR